MQNELVILSFNQREAVNVVQMTSVLDVVYLLKQARDLSHVSFLYKHAMKRSRSLHGQFRTNHLGPIHTNPNTFLRTNRMRGFVWMRPKFCHQVSSCWICSSRMLQRSVTRAISGLGRAAFPSIPWSLYQIRVRAKSDINVLFSTYKKKNSF